MLNKFFGSIAAFLVFSSVLLAEGDEIQPINADVHDDAIPSLVNYTSMPSSTVNGCVNVISGDYIESGLEDEVSGPDPYLLGHNYCSSSLDEGNLGNGWTFFHQHFLEVFQEEGIQYVKKSTEYTPQYFLCPITFSDEYKKIMGEEPLFDRQVCDFPLFQEAKNQKLNIVEKALVNPKKDYDDPIFISIYEPSGGRLLFKADYEHHRKKRCMRSFKLVGKNTGFTNTSHGNLSGQTNLKNITVEWTKKFDHFTVKLGNGAKRIYKREKPKKGKNKKYAKRGLSSRYRHYRLHKEVNPNGNFTRYYYNEQHKLEFVKTWSKSLKLLNWIYFEQKSDEDFDADPTLEVLTSDGLKYKYHFIKFDSDKLKGVYCVSKIEPQGRASTEFIYSSKNDYDKPRVTEKRLQDGSYIKTSYYKGTGNGDDISGTQGKSKNELAFLKNRVAEQRAFINGKEVITHRYTYYNYDDKGKAGHCKVLDAHNNETKYYWDTQKRLKKIIRCDDKSNIQMVERFIWGETNSYNEGNLRAHIIEDEQNNIKLAHKYKYDSRGNVLEDVLITNVNKTSGKIWFNDDLTHSQTCDRIVTTYTYNHKNQKTSEKDPLGNFTYYQYTDNNLLKAKFVCDQTAIRLREFYKYDDYAVLVEKIVDDGTSWKVDDFSGVTERHVTKVTPRLEMPHFGEPVEVLQYYIDPKTHQEVLLNKVVNHYDNKGLVVKKEAIDQVGTSTIFEYTYDDIGRVLSTKDPVGNVELIEYDAYGRISKKIAYRGDVSCIYTYDAQEHLVSESEVHDDGLVLTTEYQYDFLGRKVAVKDPQGNCIRTEYDAMNRVTKVIYPDIYDQHGNSKTPVKTYFYTSLGSEVTETDELGQVTKITYNALGKIIQKVSVDGTSVQYFYDHKGNVIEETAANGAKTTMTYDFLGRLVHSSITNKGKCLGEFSNQYNTFHLLKEVSATGETLDHSYDLAGRKIATSQNMRQTTFEYNSKGLLAKETTILEDGYINKEYGYDALNRPIRETTSDHLHDIRTYCEYSYDKEGNKNAVIQNIDGQYAKSEAIYKPHGMISEQTDALGNKTFYNYDYNHINDHGQRVLRQECIDSKGITTEQIYDARQNVSRITVYDPLHFVIAQKDLFYDVANACVRIEEKAINNPTIGTVVTCFEYSKNRLITLVEAAKTAEEKTTSYKYDDFGQLQNIIHADGVTLNHTYDSKGRLEHFYSNDHSVDYVYSYDNSDRILEVQNLATGNKTIRSYNNFGEVSSEILESGLKVAYGYDQAGRVQELTLPDASKVKYDYSAHLDVITRCDDNNKELYVCKMAERDLSGNIKALQLPGAAGNLHFAKDKLGRSTKIQHAHFEQQVPDNGFDSTGNLLQIKGYDPQGPSNRTFTYDHLSQLTQETGPSSHTYSYDSLFNRLTRDDQEYSVNSLHAVLSDSKRSFTYDARGNRLKKQESSGDTQYIYDALDRLVKVISPDTTSSYSYDAFNRRLSKQIIDSKCHTTKESYLYIGDNEVGAVDTNQTITELRILGEGYGAEIAASVAFELYGQTYVPLHDFQGNVAVLLDLQGNAIETYRYDAFGNETIYSKTPTHNPWRFSSKRTDQETGLIYFGRRYYDPTIGKWLTQDPLGVKEGPNLYAYVLNCPMTNFDEYGLYVVDDRGDMHHDTRDFTRDLAARRDGHEGRGDSSVKHPMYSNYMDDKFFTFTFSAEEEEEKGSFWLNVFDYSLIAADGVMLAYDIQATATLMSGVVFLPNLAIGAAEKAVALGGRKIINKARTYLAQKIARTQASKISTSVAQHATTDFIMSEVVINGKKVSAVVDVKSTLKRIKQGIKHPHVNDGAVFENRLKSLPEQTYGYYKEFVLPTPGVSHAGVQRIITGKNGKIFYTPDHYRTFYLLN
ncbi:MAG: hypothetical protein LLF94_04965 [Chlamydiales bacterium]|nr:hypothetical protein [Chlamydiales bacterium]